MPTAAPLHTMVPRCAAVVFFVCLCDLFAAGSSSNISSDGSVVLHRLRHAQADITVPVSVYVGGAIDASQINGDGSAPLIGLRIASTSNVTWNLHRTVANLQLTFASRLAGYDDPLGLATLIGTPLSIAMAVVSPNGKDVNVTLSKTLCYSPKQHNVLYMYFGANATSEYGAIVVQTVAATAATTGDAVDGPSADVYVVGAIAVSMRANVDNDAESDGLILVGLICACCAVCFLLGNWFDALFTLMQLQLLVLLCFTSCAPASAAAIFNKAVWVLWPLSTHTSDVTNPEDQGRMLFNFIFIGIMFLVQCVAVVLFAYFASNSRAARRGGAPLDPRTRVKFPQGTLFVAGFLFQGSAMSCIKTFALHYLGFLGNDVAGPLALAVCTSIFLISQLVVIWVAVFRIVSQQVFLEPLTKSFFVFAFLGGNWANADVRKQWGVLFDGVNGSSFWFLGSTFALAALNAMFAGFVPGGVDGCTTQYYLMLVTQVVQLILVFVRRPFKSVAQNVLNIVVTILQTVAVVAFVSAMECSRMQSRFSSFAVWFCLCALFVKSVMSMVLQVVIQAHNTMRKPLRVPTEPRRAVVPQRHNDFASRRKAAALQDDEPDALAMQLLDNIDVEAEERSIVYPLDEAMDRNVQKTAALWKPLLPQPILLGGNVVSREVGFGGKGGLVATEGPSVALKLCQPAGLCADADRLYILDSGNNRILSHAFAQHRCATLCGGQPTCGYGGDLGYDPALVAMDTPRFIAMGQRCLYYADTGNDCVRRMDLATQQNTTVIGGTAAAATLQLSRPMGLQLHNQHLYVADSGNHRILMYDFQENITVSVCGTGYPGYDGDGVFAAASRLNNPQGLCLNPSGGQLYIADTGNHRVVTVDPTSHRMHVLLGIPGRGGESHGSSVENVRGSTLQLCLPTDVACGPDGSVLVVDGGNAKVWIVNRFGFARVILPPSDDVIPRHVCVPRAARGAGFGGAVLPAVSGNSTATAGRFKGGTSLATAVLSSPTHSSHHNDGSEAMSTFVFYVADSVHHMVVAVDASVSRGTSFTVERLYTMAHPEAATATTTARRLNWTGGTSSSARTGAREPPHPTAGSSTDNLHRESQEAYAAMLMAAPACKASDDSPLRMRDYDDPSTLSPIEMDHPEHSMASLKASPSWFPVRRLYERPVVGRASSVNKSRRSSPQGPVSPLSASGMQPQTVAAAQTLGGGSTSNLVHRPPPVLPLHDTAHSTTSDDRGSRLRAEMEEEVSSLSSDESWL